MTREGDRARVRLGAARYAAHLYRTLRPADQASVRFVADDATGLRHESVARDGTMRRRALRTDEALAVLDAQLVIEDVHSLDRRKVSLLRISYDLGRMMLTRAFVPGSYGLRMMASRQYLGERFWWACPFCDRRCRYLYHYRVAGGQPPEDIVACRLCLGLTYASRSRHRCADQDRKAAARGDAEAAERRQRRLKRAMEKAARERKAREALRNRFRRRVFAVARELGHDWGHIK